MNSYLVIISGASRGFGKAVAITLSKHILASQLFVLIGRSKESLDEVVTEIKTQRGDLPTRYQLVIADLETPEGLATSIGEIFQEDFFQFSHILFFTNAGTLGPLGAIGTSFDSMAVSRCIQLNVTSPCTLISEFVKQYKASGTEARATVINTSSLWAVEPASSFGWYSATKSAVEMFMEVASEENKRQFPLLRFLNYAPGPLEGDMQQTIRESPSVDQSIRTSCQSLYDRGQLVPPHVSALKCIRIAIEEVFRTGDHIDFYDQIDGIDTQRPAPTTCCANPSCQCGPGCNCKQSGAQCGACQSFLLGNRLPK